MGLTRFFILFLFAKLSFNAQVKVDTLRFYFPINVFSAESHAPRLDSLSVSLHGKLIKVKIFGYADFLHHDQYNQLLSQRRSDAIKDYFYKVYPHELIGSISSKGMGERTSKDNGSKEGDPYARRVEMIIEPILIRQDNDTPVADTTKHLEEHEEKIEKLKVGESLALEGLNFEPGRHFIVKASIPVINNLLKIMKSNPGLKIEIQGHICCLDGQGDGRDLDTGLFNLSVARAKAVHDFLIRNGIDAERLSYKGFGHSKPKFWPETTPEEEQANRRVEILVLDK